MDYLPDDLTDDECAELHALVLRRALPAELTPSKLIVLAYPAEGATRERKTLLHAMCAALMYGELNPSGPVRLMKDLPPHIAAKWSGERPSFNPIARVRFVHDLSMSSEQEVWQRGLPESDFDIPIPREEFLRWSRSLLLDLPGYAALRTYAPDEMDKARSDAIEILAELDRLPAWLTREEIFRLWYPKHFWHGNRSIASKRLAHSKLFAEDSANGRLKCFKDETKQSAPLPVRSSSDFDLVRRQDEPQWIPELPENWLLTGRQAEPAPSTLVTIWLHRDDMEVWLRLRKIELPDWAPLRRWFPLTAKGVPEVPATADRELSRKRSEYGAAGQKNRGVTDWRPLVDEGRALMPPRGKLSASDAARSVSRKHGLTGANTAALTKQTKTLANKLTEGGRTSGKAD